MASWLSRSSPDRTIRVEALAGDIVFLGKTLHSHSASLQPGVKMVTGFCDIVQPVGTLLLQFRDHSVSRDRAE